MAELSGTAKLSNGDPASQIVAVHPLRGHVRSTVPALDGSYAIPGVPKGKWLVTAEGPAGYRPLTHVLDVERVPEAETLYPKIWESWNFDGNLLGNLGRATYAGTSTGTFVAGRIGQALVPAGGGRHGYQPGTLAASAVLGYATWWKRTGVTAAAFPAINGRTNSNSNTRDVLDPRMSASGVALEVQSRLSTAGAWPLATIPAVFDVDVWVHVAFAVQASGLTVWIDGVRYHFPASNASDTTGERHISLTGMGASAIDDLMQFRAMPTDDEIKYLYNSGAGRTWAEVVEDAGFE